MPTVETPSAASSVGEAPTASPTNSTTDPPSQTARVLSYNFNLLPNCISFSNAYYAEERVAEFASRVGNKFDIIALQEVFSSSLVPVAAREYWCSQHQLIHLLSEPQRTGTEASKGGAPNSPKLPQKSSPSAFAPALYPYVVKARQPSFLRMTLKTVITDSGLLILSKFPIVDSGSMHFRSSQHWGRQIAPKGCLFAKIRLSDTLCVLVVNVHLSSSSTAQETSSEGPISLTVSEQLKEMRHFIETIQSEHPQCPLIVTGDFNINSIVQSNIKKDGSSITPAVTSPTPAQVTSPNTLDEPSLMAPTPIPAEAELPNIAETEAYQQLVATIKSISGDTCEVLRDSAHHHPPTRPATLTFPSFLNKMVATRFPQRHDYCFFTNNNAPANQCFTLSHPRLQRFTSSSQTPYMYLSDHFGISVGLRNANIDLQKALRHEGTNIHTKLARSWFYPLLKNARSLSRKDFSNGWESYFESALLDSAFKVIGYIFFPMLASYLLVGIPALRYVAALIVAGLAARHIFGNRVVTELAETDFGIIDKEVMAGNAPVARSNKSIGAPASTINNPPSCIWEMWSRSVNDFKDQHCLGFRSRLRSGADVRWMTYHEVDREVRTLGAALKGLGAEPGSVIGVLIDCHHLNAIIDLACQGYGYLCLPLVADAKLSRDIIDSHGCKIAITSRKYTPRILLATSKKLTCVVQLENIGGHEFDLSRNASIDLRGYEQLLKEQLRKEELLKKDQSINEPLDTPLCEEQAAASFEASAAEGQHQTSPAVSLSTFSSATATYFIGDEEEFTLTRKQMVNAVIAAMETNLVQDRRTIPNKTGQKASIPANVFGVVAPFSNGFNRTLAFAVLASGHKLAVCEQLPSDDLSLDLMPLSLDLMALRPDVLICNRSYLTDVNAQLAEFRYCWLRHHLFRWAYRFRSKLIRHYRRDSNSLRSLFFSNTFSQKLMRAPGVTCKRLIVESPSVSLPYRVKEMAMLCLTPVVRECVVDAFGQLVAVDGVPPPRTMITLEPLGKEATAEGAEDNAGNVMLKRVLADGNENNPWHDTKLVALWKQDLKLQFLAARGDLLLPMGGVRAVATDLEELYKSACPMIHDIFITCDDHKQLLAVIVPLRTEVDDLLEQRHSTACNWTAFTQHAPPLFMNSLNQIAKKNNLPPAHYIELIHIHPHPFSAHSDFVSASGGLRRKRLREYFRTSIYRLYNGRVANGGGGLTSVAGSGDVDDPFTPVTSERSASSFGVQQPSYALARRDMYAGPQAASPIAIDIGGTCAKFVFFQPPNAPSLPSFCQLSKVEASFALPKNIRFFRNQEAAVNDTNAGELRFVQCSTQDVPAMVQYIADNKLCDKYTADGLRYIPATGGGAFRFAPLIKSQLGIELTQLNEMDSIIAGINFILRYAPELTFTFDIPTSKRVPGIDPSVAAARPNIPEVATTQDSKASLFEASTTSLPPTPPNSDAVPQAEPKESNETAPSLERQQQLKDEFTASFFPYLLVNIGSGVSLVKCNSEKEGDFIRVGGSLIGGGTFWGLVRSMTDLKSWDEINEMTRIDGPGDNTNVDLLVGDIYGYNATKLPGNLHVDIIASTFGKIGADRGDRYSQDGMVGAGYGHAAQEDSLLEDTEGISGIGSMGPSASTSTIEVHHSRRPSSMGYMEGSEYRPSSTGLPFANGTQPNPLISGSVVSTGTSPSSRSGQPRPQPIDIVRSLVIMMAFNVSQLANLHCKIEGIGTVFFTGGFVRNNPIVHNQLTKALDYWSGGKLKARFLEPDGYVGTIGSLQHIPKAAATTD